MVIKMLKTNLKNLIVFFLVLSLAFFGIITPAFAGGRSGAGGGDLAKFDTGKFALGVAIGLGSSMVGSAIGSAYSGNTFTYAGAFSKWGTGYQISMATGQTGRAVGAAGQYYGWNTKGIVMASSIVSSMVQGGLGGGVGGGFGGFAGMAKGAVGGLTEGAILSSVMKKDGSMPIWAGPVASVAGAFTTGVFTGDPAGKSGRFAYGFGQSFSKLLPAAIKLGENQLIKNNPKNAMLISSAMSGIYVGIDTALEPRKVNWRIDGKNAMQMAFLSKGELYSSAAIGIKQFSYNWQSSLPKSISSILSNTDTVSTANTSAN